MLTKKLIAGLAATAVVAGAIAASGTSASAHGSAPIYQSHKHDFNRRDSFNRIWDAVESAFSRRGPFAFGGRKVCAPVYARTWAWSPTGWTLKTVKVDEKCDWRPYGFGPDW